MAVFTKTRDLLQQKQGREFKKQTGWKAAAMGVLGRNPDGTLREHGKVFNFIPGASFASKALAKGSDAEDVIGEHQGRELKTVFDTAKLVGEVLTMGASGAATGATNGVSSGVGAGAKTGSGLLSSSSSKTNILGNNISNFGQNTGTAFAGGGGDLAKTGGGLLGNAGQGSKGTMFGGLMNKIGGGAGNSSSQSMFKNGIGEDLVKNTLNNEEKKLTEDLFNNDNEELLDEDNYVQGDIEVDTPNEQEYDDESDATKVSKSVSKITSAIPIAGTAVNLIADKFAIADAYKNTKKKIASKKIQGSNKRVA